MALATAATNATEHRTRKDDREQADEAPQGDEHGRLRVSVEAREDPAIGEP